MPEIPSPSFGIAGTFHFPLGFAITCTFPVGGSRSGIRAVASGDNRLHLQSVASGMVQLDLT